MAGLVARLDAFRGEPENPCDPVPELEAAQTLGSAEVKPARTAPFQQECERRRHRLGVDWRAELVREETDGPARGESPGDALACRAPGTVASTDDQGDSHHGGRGVAGEEGVLPRELGPTIDAERSRDGLLVREGLLPGEDEIGGQAHEADSPGPAGGGKPTREAGVDGFGDVRAGLAQVGAAEHGRVNDGVRPLPLEKVDGSGGLGELGGDGAEARGRVRPASHADHVEAVLGEEGSDASPEEAAGAGDEDAHLSSGQPTITDPPLTERTWPCI